MERRTIRFVYFILFGLQVAVLCDQNSLNSNSSNAAGALESNSLKTDDPRSRFTDGCHFQQGNLTCRQVLHLNATYLSTISSSIVSIDIVQGLFRDLNQSGLLQVTYPFLGKLTIRNSAVTVVDSLPDSNTLVEVHLINNLNLWSVSLNSAVVKRLQILNLSNNGLERIQDLSEGTNLKSSGLNLSGNEWDCKSDFSWILKLHESGVLVNGDKLLCRDFGITDSWFEWSYSLLGQVKIKRKVKAECQIRTPKCECRFTSRGKEGRDSYSVQVDCYNKSLTSLPKELPDFTDELDVSLNALRNLDQIKNYTNQALKTIIADSNHIESILSLASSKFMANFSIFSLKHNRISPSQIPLEDLVNVPNNSFQTKYVYLYNNSWECDCKMATDVRNWLWRNHHIVNDSSLLLCSRDGRKIPVMYLFPDAVCPTREGQHYPDEETKIYLLHCVIYIEVALIVILALKLAYDSWHYFRHGELPWIATKLL